MASIKNGLRSWFNPWFWVTFTNGRWAFLSWYEAAQVILDVGIDFDLPHSSLPVCASHKEDHLNKVCMRWGYQVMVTMSDQPEVKIEKILMSSYLQVQLLQTSRKVPGFLRVLVLWALLSIPIIGLPYFKYIYNSYFKYRVLFHPSSTANTLHLCTGPACYRHFKAGTLIGRKPANQWAEFQCVIPYFILCPTLHKC